MRIELINDIDGVLFEDCYRRRVLEEIDGITLPLICLADLLVNKRASNRPKDQVYVEGLTK